MENIIELLKKAWSLIKKTFFTVFTFLKNIVQFFKAKFGIASERSSNVKAISIIINDKIKSGDFKTIDIGLDKVQVVNTFYDEIKGEIMEDLSEIVSADSLDKESFEKFGGKEMLIFN